MNKRIMIKEGIYFNAIKTDRFKSGYVSMKFLCPLNESNGSRALIPFVLKRGCKIYPNMTLVNRQLEELYGANLSVNVLKRGETQVIDFGIKFVDNAYALRGENIGAAALALLFEIIFNPLLCGDNKDEFNADFVRTEKENLIELIKSEMNDKRHYSILRLDEVMCKNESFGLNELGNISHIESIAPKSAYEAYLNIIKTSQIEIFYGGNFNESKILRMLSIAFENIEREFISPTKTEVIAAAATIHEHAEELNVEQGKLCLGFRTGTVCGNDDFNALVVMNSVFGAGVTSKLFLNVREKLQICYYCSSNIDKIKGIMRVNSGIAIENKQVAQDEILHQLKEVQNGNISEDELTSAKLSIINSFKQALDSHGAMVEWIFSEIVAGTNRTIDDAISGIEKVTSEEVKAASNKLSLDTIYFLTKK